MDRKEKVVQFYERHRRMPSYGEMMTLLGYKSKAAVHYFVDKLIEAGVVEKDAQGRLIPGLMLGGTRLLGLVEAGFPSAAEEETLDVLNFDEYLVPNKESTYILKVKGDSMIDAGIQSGDMVVVERRASYKPGQIVVAMVDNEYTMKYLRQKPASTRDGSSTRGGDGEYYLEAANSNYKNIYPKESFRVEAVVTAVVRKY